MTEVGRTDEPDIPCSDERCAGVPRCAADLPARGVPVCRCVYTAHHTPPCSPPEEASRCAGPDQSTPTGEPEHFADVADRVLDDLATRQQGAMDRLRRQHRNVFRGEKR